MTKLACSLLAVHLAAAGLFAKDGPATNPTAVLATVGDNDITEADFQLFCAIHHIPPEKQPAVRNKLVGQLVERQLIRRFLARQNIQPDADALATVIHRTEDLIRRRKDDPDELLKRLGLSREKLEAELGLFLAWEAYVRLAVTDKQIAEHFEKHRAELDGTKVRASQIILKTRRNAPEKEIAERKATLAAVRKEIVAKKLTFAEAAQKYSQAPSRDKGGDIGFFPFRGVQPEFFGDIAFALEVGDISEPVVSPFGVHLIQVTDKQPGPLTLEDVRKEIVQRLAQDLWRKAAAQERETSKVVIQSKS